MPKNPRLAVLLALAVLAASTILGASSARAAGDQALLTGAGGWQLLLPSGAGEAAYEPSTFFDVSATTYDPEGRLLAVGYFPVDGGVSAQLVEVTPESEIVVRGELDVSLNAGLGDLAFATDGALYMLLTDLETILDPPGYVNRLLRLDPANGEILESQILGLSQLSGQASALAPAPGDDLWLIAGTTLFRLDPATGTLSPRGASAPNGVVSLAADIASDGDLWLLVASALPSPPVIYLQRLDPQSLEQENLFIDLPQDSRTLAILPGSCPQTERARCLQDGRFLVETTWRDFAGQAGDGRWVPGSSDDSTLFWFFNENNWELLVKVLDGCENNGHYWVFAAGLTNVEFELRVTDLDTGVEWSTQNTLGTTARAVTDTTAFATCP